mgnify:FL=1
MRWLVYIALLLYTPTLVSAQVLITEIMYAPEGADANREWVEVCNSGSEVNIENWKFFENDTNHGLSLISGTASLTSGSCAVIADDADVFLGDHPSFSGNLFDSAFSLKNTGETIALKDDSGSEVDRVTYSDADGAKDDGLSLHRNSNSWTPSTPTPGIGSGIENSNPEQGPTNEASGNEPPTTNTTLYSYESVTIEPPQDIFIRVPTEITTVAYSHTIFKIESYDATGSAIDSGKVSWSFGDGGEARGREVSHRFLYPGEYIVTVSLELGSLFDTKQIRLIVVPLEAKLYVAPDGSWVSIENQSEQQLDMSQWRILSSGQYFRVPDKTAIPAMSEVRFATEVTKLTTLRAQQQATLVYPDGTLALQSVKKPEANEEIKVQDSTAEVQQPAGTITTAPTRSQIYAPEVAIAEAAAAVTVAAQKERGDVASATQTGVVILESGHEEENRKSPYWYFALAALLTFAVSIALLGKPKALVVDGFEIVEEKN